MVIFLTWLNNEKIRCFEKCKSMKESEIIQLISDLDSREEVVKAAITDEKVRDILFSIIQKRAKDKSLNVPMGGQVATEAESKRIDTELGIIDNVMDVVSRIAEQDPRLVQSIIPTIIRFLDYEFFFITEKVAKIIIYSPNNDNIELFAPAVPKLVP